MLWFRPPNALGQTPPAPKRILSLHWEDKDDTAEAFDGALQDALRSAAPGPVEFYSEYLDATRFPGEGQSQALAAYLRRKYASRKIDVVVTDTPPPLDFLFKYRSELFRDTPIVFATTERPGAAQLAAGAGATGITYSGYRKTLELALRLHPASEHVFIVSSSLPAGPSWERLVRADLKGFQTPADITYLTDLSLDELSARLRTLPRRSIVLYVWQRGVNRQGVVLDTHDLLRFIAPSVPAPIYGLSFANIGLGIVGGYVWTRETRAAKLAEMTLELASGTRPADVPVENSPLVPMFDWRQLQRWGIAEDDLPPDSIIRFREPSMWRQYKWRIVGTFGLVVLQTVLIGALLILSRRANRRAAALAEAQRVLQESEERFRRVFDEGPLGIALVGKDYRFLKVNDALCRMVGYDAAELLRMSFLEVTHPDDARADGELAERLFKRQIPFYRIQKRYIKKTGEIIWINLTASILLGPDGEPVHGIAMIEDITEIRRGQDEALVRQKLDSLGTLAGGIAHDFNNLLGAIQAQAELILSDADASSSFKEELQTICHITIRGSEIVRQLMIYAGAESGVVELIDLSKMVDEMLALLKVSVAKRAVIQPHLDRDLPAIRASAAQIRQVLMNLITNASDAIGDRDGTITVITERISLKGESAAISNVPDGEYVGLAVSDTGRGMSPETQAKIFDPFFTTKSAGRGIGLAVVQGVVRSLGGSVHVASEPGKGTTFKILLPCAEAAADSRGSSITAVENSPSRSPLGAILVVEDEHPLRQAVVRMLRKAGFEVYEAADGSSAIDRLRTDGCRIDVMLLDMTIPGASSQEVVAEAVNAMPNIKVILTSAYSKEMIDGTMNSAQIHSFIRKPFKFEELLTTLRASLPS